MSLTSTLTRASGAALGVAVAVVLLLRCGHHAAGAATVRPPPAALTAAAVADDAGPLREVLMHYVPEEEASFRPAYRDFLLSLAPETRVLFVVRRQDRARVDAFLATLDATGALSHRVRVVEIGRPLGIWSKDRALVLGDAGAGGPAGAKIELVVPPRTRAGEGSRPADWDIVPAVAAALPEELEVRQLPIAFDAGDFAITKSRVLFDVNLFARNRARGFRSPEELRDRVKALLGRDVLMLGTEVGDVPRHHMSMYMALLDGNVALVGDPAAGAKLVGLDYIPGETSPESGALLRADFTPATQARFERAAGDLAAAGFRVVRIPTVPFDDKTYFAYTNGVYETRAGRRVAWVPSFGV
ncbi:MAG: hypothetical protein JWO86_2046, partial [Myxococcaceae bacterium]|nr:hypothetical protein [Myxococcaceae bacterium]